MSSRRAAGARAPGRGLRAGCGPGHAVIGYGDLTGSGKNKLAFDQIAIDRATAYSAEDADVILRLWRVLKPRLVAERMTAGYETLERPLVSLLARMERRGISIHPPGLSRPSGDFAPTPTPVQTHLPRPPP